MAFEDWFIARAIRRLCFSITHRPKMLFVMLKHNLRAEEE